MIPRKSIFPAKSFRDVTCLPMTRKTLVTKENPNNDGDGSFHFCEDYKLVRSMFFLVWLDLGTRKMSVTATKH